MGSQRDSMEEERKQSRYHFELDKLKENPERYPHFRRYCDRIGRERYELWLWRKEKCDLYDPEADDYNWGYEIWKEESVDFELTMIPLYESEILVLSGVEPKPYEALLDWVNHVNHVSMYISTYSQQIEDLNWRSLKKESESR
jgi:hypothetical protein